MSTTTDAKLIRMANQIATFFASQPGETQAADTAAHLQAFWDPRMRDRLFELMDQAEGEGLSPLARSAAETWREGVAG